VPLKVYTEDASVWLQRRPPGGKGDPTLVCAGSCEEIIDGRNGDKFQFAGPNISESGDFDMTRMAGYARVQVRPGSQRTKDAGIVMAGVGGLLVLAVGPALFLAAQRSSDTPDGEKDHTGESGSGGVAMLGVLTGLGFASAILGGILAVANRTTFEFR
jgi:hypothetical protein